MSADPRARNVQAIPSLLGRRKPVRRWTRRVFRGALILALSFTGLLAFGLSGADYAALLSFTQAVDRWQHDPEFRTIAIEYSACGSAAMRTRPFFIPAKRLIIAIRSVPGLPKEFAVNPTSRAHYENFSRGPLSAYLHLCREQDLPAYVTAVGPLGRKTGRTLDDCRDWLGDRKMDFPIARDRGAALSVAIFLDDADAARPFEVRDGLPTLLLPQIAAVASRLGYPTDPGQMTADQQKAVLDRLDDYVHHHDPELWRAKQVSDLSGGIWAQVFGPPYNELLVPILALHTACRLAFVLLLLACVVRLVYARRAKAAVVPTVDRAGVIRGTEGPPAGERGADRGGAGADGAADPSWPDDGYARPPATQA
jgi:hypothetical protein